MGAPPLPGKVERAGDTSETGGGAADKPPPAPGTPPVASSPEAMTKVLDLWQAAATTALRKCGVAYDPEAAAAAWSLLPGQMYLAIDRELYGCASVPEVSAVFKDARAILRVGTEKLEKVMAPQHVLRALTSSIDEVFMARGQDAQRLLADELRADDAPFETEVTPAEGERPAPPLERA